MDKKYLLLSKKKDMQQKIANFIASLIVKNWLLIILFSIFFFICWFLKSYEHNDLFVYPFKVEVWGTFSDWITSIASILTLVVAVIALYSWKHQKHYDLEIEAKANAWKAADYIYKFTTVPMDVLILTGDDEERFKNLLSKSEVLATCYLEAFVIEYVRHKNEEKFIELNTIAETVKAQFYEDKKRQNVYSFYKLFVESYFDIYNKAFEFQTLKYEAYREGQSINQDQFNIYNDFFYKGGLQEIARKIGEAQTLVVVDPRYNKIFEKHVR